jgi:hypothetical protein
MRNLWLFSSSLALLGSALLSVSGVLASAPGKPPAEPAKISIEVTPEATPAGERAEVSLRLSPIDGVVINRYPQMKLSVDAVEGLVGSAETAVGNVKPPPVDQMDTNYYDVVDPLNVTLETDPGASPGRHEIDARLVYFYCVKKSGFCAPARLTVKIPLEIR